MNDDYTDKTAYDRTHRPMPNDGEAEPAAPVQAGGTTVMSEERLQDIEKQIWYMGVPIHELCAEIRRLRSPDQRTLAAYQQGVEDGRSAPAQPAPADSVQTVPG